MYYYSSATGQTYSAYQMQALFGIDVETTDISILNQEGFYPVQETSPDFDVLLYNPTYTWSIVSILPSGQGAERVWVANPKPLPEAKANAIAEEKSRADAETSTILGANNVSAEVMTSVAGQLLIDRPASLQTVLAEMQVVSDNLGANITAINAAATVDDINNIVNPPTGVIHIGRTGTDFDPSYYLSFNSVSLTEADTELYIPGTSTVVVYGFYVPGEFDTPPGAFNVGDYLIQIREVATSRVISEFECPEGYEDIAF